MQEETEFIVLEGVMIVITVLAQTVFHPGLCFPALGNTIGKRKQAQGSGSETDVEMLEQGQAASRQRCPTGLLGLSGRSRETCKTEAICLIGTWYACVICVI